MICPRSKAKGLAVMAAAHTITRSRTANASTKATATLRSRIRELNEGILNDHNFKCANRTLLHIYVKEYFAARLPKNARSVENASTAGERGRRGTGTTLPTRSCPLNL